MGYTALAQIIRSPSDYARRLAENDFPDLAGLDLGETYSGGRLVFSPVPNYRYSWFVPGLSEEGWKGRILSGGVSNGREFQFTVRFEKDVRRVDKTFRTDWTTVMMSSVVDPALPKREALKIVLADRRPPRERPIRHGRPARVAAHSPLQQVWNNASKAMDAVDPSETPEQKMWGREVRDAFRALWHALSREERKMVHAIYDHDVLKITAFGAHLQKVRQKLQSGMADFVAPRGALLRRSA